MKRLNPLHDEIVIPFNEVMTAVVNSISPAAKAAIHRVLRIEGNDFVHDPDDAGGATRFGISDLRDGKEDGLIDIDLDGIGDVDPEDLTYEQAVYIFYKDYWMANNCHELPEYIALIIFDIAVNQSAVFARKALQLIIGAKPDGIIGKNTLAALKGHSKPHVMHHLTKRRCMRYGKRVRREPEQVKYLIGWLDRAFTVLEAAQEIHVFGGNHE